jgi:excisionase family DNA binding protein
MSQQHYTFDQLPSIVAMLAAEIKELKALLTEQGALQKHDPNEMMSLKRLQEFHPDHPAAQTIYGWVHSGQIPYYKTGKKLIFKRSEIEAWINEGRRMSSAEITAQAIDYVNSRRTDQ